MCCSCGLAPASRQRPSPPSPQQGQEKMSKSDPNSAIFMEDTEAEVKTKIKKAFCPPGVVEGNPCLAYIQHIVLPWNRSLEVSRSEQNGGNKYGSSGVPGRDIESRRSVLCATIGVSCAHVREPPEAGAPHTHAPSLDPPQDVRLLRRSQGRLRVWRAAPLGPEAGPRQGHQRYTSGTCHVESIPRPP